MTLDDRIASIRTLLKERDEIDARLAQLIGDEPQSTPSEKPAKRASRAAEPTPKKGAKVCKKCGKPGHMAKTCDRAANAPEKSEGTAKLSQDQYDELRDAMHDREFMSAKYSLTRKLPPREMNAAIRSTDYENYLESR